MEYWTRKEIAVKFGVKAFQVRRWEKSGKIKPAFLLSGRYPRYETSQLLNIVEVTEPVDNKEIDQADGE